MTCWAAAKNAMLPFSLTYIWTRQQLSRNPTMRGYSKTLGPRSLHGSDTVKYINIVDVMRLCVNPMHGGLTHPESGAYIVWMDDLHFPCRSTQAGVEGGSTVETESRLMTGRRRCLPWWERVAMNYCCNGAYVTNIQLLISPPSTASAALLTVRTDKTTEL